ncbi:MAG: protein kinase [Polyangiaceae bacterium]|nr:protein kinase [Polyangiaceae bacterium]
MSPSASSVACALCGADCEAEARFCPFCGSAIAAGHKGNDALLGIVLAGTYRLTERIGADAIARVFRAERIPGGEVVAVRVVHDHLTRDGLFVEALQARVQESQQLVHPGILRVLAGGCAQVTGRSVYFVVVEPFEGRNLCAIVQARGLLPIAQVRLIGEQLLDALAEAHRLGVTHGDLKTENVVIGATADGEVRVKLNDFGIGLAAATALPSLCAAGTTLGTALYRAPEQSRTGVPSPAADVYAMGALLYEQFTGEPPFVSTSCFEVERMHLMEEVVSARERAPDRAIPEELAAIVLQALAKNPVERFKDASVMRHAFAQAVATDDAASAVCDDAPKHVSPRRLVGRAELMDTLMRVATAPVAYGEADQGLARGGVAIVLGGAGMGKSELLDEVVQRLAGGAISVLRVATSRPIEPFVQLLRRLLALDCGADAEAVRHVAEVLETRFRFEPDDVVRLVDRVAGRPSSLSVTLELVEREEVRALRSVLGRIVAMRPTLLLVDDADALDHGSLRLVSDLMEASATLALAVLVTARGEPWPDWDAQHVVRLTVPGLAENAALSLLRASVACSDVSSDALRPAVVLAKGSPLLLDLCGRAMRGSKLLPSREGGDATCSSSERFGGLRELVARNLGAAPIAARRWISMAALGGVSTPIALLEAWEPAEPSRPAVLAACVASGFVRVDVDRLVFRNDGVRSVVRALVAEQEASSMHRFAAGWWQSPPSQRVPGELIATHWELAGELDQAVVWLERDARELLGRDEPRAAAELFGRAVRLSEKLDDGAAVARLGLLRVEAWLLAGEGKLASDALAELERCGATSAHGLRARLIASVAEVQGDRDLALRALQRASELALDSLDQHAWYAVEFQLAEVLYRSGALGEAQTHASRAHELAQAIADSHAESTRFEDGSRIAQAASFLSRIWFEQGRLDEAKAVLLASLRHAAVLGDEASGARLLAHLAHARAADGDAQAALDCGSRALSLARRAGDRMASARIAINVGAYQAKLGRRDDAIASFTLAKTLARAVGWTRGLRLATQAVSNLGV